MLVGKYNGDRFIMDRPAIHPQVHSHLQGPDSYHKFLYREMLADQANSSLEQHLLKRMVTKNQHQ